VDKLHDETRLIQSFVNPLPTAIFAINPTIHKHHTKRTKNGYHATPRPIPQARTRSPRRPCAQNSPFWFTSPWCARADSDVDYLVLVREVSAEVNTVLDDEAGTILAQEGRVISAFAVSEADFERFVFSPIFINIRREGIAA
jgi:hypothetical protein